MIVFFYFYAIRVCKQHSSLRSTKGKRLLVSYRSKLRLSSHRMQNLVAYWSNFGEFLYLAVRLTISRSHHRGHCIPEIHITKYHKRTYCANSPAPPLFVVDDINTRFPLMIVLKAYGDSSVQGLK